LDTNGKIKMEDDEMEDDEMEEDDIEGEEGNEMEDDDYSNEENESDDNEEEEIDDEEEENELPEEKQLNILEQLKLQSVGDKDTQNPNYNPLQALGTEEGLLGLPKNMMFPNPITSQNNDFNSSDSKRRRVQNTLMFVPTNKKKKSKEAIEELLKEIADGFISENVDYNKLLKKVEIILNSNHKESRALNYSYSIHEELYTQEIDDAHTEAARDLLENTHLKPMCRDAYLSALGEKSAGAWEKLRDTYLMLGNEENKESLKPLYFEATKHLFQLVPENPMYRVEYTELLYEAYLLQEDGLKSFSTGKRQITQTSLIKQYKAILNAIPRHPFATKRLAESYYYDNEFQKAQNLLEKHVFEADSESSEDSIDNEIVNMLCDIYSVQDMHDRVLKVIEHIMNFNMLSSVYDLPPELITKQAMALIRLRKPNLDYEQLVVYIMSLNDNYIDCIQDIGISFYTMGQYSEAVKILTRLESRVGWMNLSRPDQLDVWNILAICHENLNSVEEAVYYYEMMINFESGSNLTKVRQRLSELYQKQGKPSQAQSILEPNPDIMSDVSSHHELQIQSCIQQLSTFEHDLNWDGYFEECQPLLHMFLHVNRLSKSTSSNQDFLPDSVKKRERELKSTHHKNKIWQWKDVMTILNNREPHMIGLILRLVWVLCRSPCSNNFRMNQAILMLNQVIKSHRLKDPSTLMDALIQISLEQKDYEISYRVVKDKLDQNIDNPEDWQRLVFIGEHLPTDLAFKYMVRKLNTNPKCLPLTLVVGHTLTARSQTQLAIGEYLHAYRLDPKEPIINLLCGISFLSYIMNRQAVDRHRLTLSAFAFLNRYRNAHHSFHATYNISRAYHQIGMYSEALEGYHKILASNTNPSIKRLAAFNASLIYKYNTNNPKLAYSLQMEFI